MWRSRRRSSMSYLQNGKMREKNTMNTYGSQQRATRRSVDGLKRSSPKEKRDEASDRKNSLS